jgi:hypothetical protein
MCTYMLTNVTYFCVVSGDESLHGHAVTLRLMRQVDTYCNCTDEDCGVVVMIVPVR